MVYMAYALIFFICILNWEEILKSLLIEIVEIIFTIAILIVESLIHFIFKRHAIAQCMYEEGDITEMTANDQFQNVVGPGHLSKTPSLGPEAEKVLTKETVIGALSGVAGSGATGGSNMLGCAIAGGVGGFTNAYLHLWDDANTQLSNVESQERLEKHEEFKQEEELKDLK